MTITLKTRWLSCLVLTGALVLSGCSMDEPLLPSAKYKAESAEDILAAEGEWKLVEEKRAPSPLEQHMETREKVHPSEISKSKSYTQDAQAMHVDEDIHFRVLRLEKQMDTVRSDLEIIKPKLAFLSEKKLAVEPPPAVKKAVKKASAKPVPKAPEKKAPPPVTGGPLRVTSVRWGQHPDKVRFVMDVTGTPKFSHDLDNAEHILVVELPSTGWEAEQKRVLGANPLIRGYRVESADQGASRLVIELKTPVKILMASAFRPNDIHGHRIVLDLAAAQ